MDKAEIQAHLDRERKRFLKHGGKVERLKPQIAVRPVIWIRGSWEPDQNAQESEPKAKNTVWGRRPSRV